MGLKAVAKSATTATGDIVGPGSSTDNAIARFDGTTGKLLQNSGVTIDDSNVLAVPGAAGPSYNFSVGSGSTTTQGWKLGTFSSGISGLWTTAVTPSTSNFILVAQSGGSTYLNSEGNSNIYFRISNVDTAAIRGTTSFVVQKDLVIGWTSNSDSTGVVDVGLVRNTIGVAELNNGTKGTITGDLKLHNLLVQSGIVVLGTFTVATLPAASTYPGGIAYVTDSLAAPVYNAGATGGGVLPAQVMSNGTTWLYS